MPLGPPKLRVHAKYIFPTAGYEVTIKPAILQGINPEILILKVSVTKPEFGADVIAKIDVQYEETLDSSHYYKQVTILSECEGSGTIDVKEVH